MTGTWSRTAFPQTNLDALLTLDVDGDSYGDVIHLREYKKSELRDLLNHFHGRIEEGSLAISPCWFGVMQLNWGIDVLPAWLENLCHFWFVVFVKC